MVLSPVLSYERKSAHLQAGSIPARRIGTRCDEPFWLNEAVPLMS
jgi:hypothetical protein